MSIRSSGWKGKIIAYPNSGEIYNAESKSWASSERQQEFLGLAKEWIEIGVDILGGCCRIGPSEIKEVKRLVK